MLTDIIPLKQTLEKHGFQESALRGDFYVKKKKKKSTVLKQDKTTVKSYFRILQYHVTKNPQTVKSADKMFKIIIKMLL